MNVTDFAQRLPVWTAMSELFLDTQLDEADYERIAAVLRASPYDRGEIETILRTEVSPVFSVNLMQIAGEWEPWSEADVGTLMLAWLRKRASRGWADRIRTWIAPERLPDDWSSVVQRI